MEKTHLILIKQNNMGENSYIVYNKTSTLLDVLKSKVPYFTIKDVFDINNTMAKQLKV